MSLIIYILPENTDPRSYCIGHGGTPAEKASKKKRMIIMGIFLFIELWLYIEKVQFSIKEIIRKHFNQNINIFYVISFIQNAYNFYKIWYFLYSSE